MPSTVTVLDGAAAQGSYYARFHERRIRRSMDALAGVGARRVVEIGGHPWTMTSAIVDDPRFELLGTVSAEEVTDWPDDIGVSRHAYRLVTASGRQAEFFNYSANIERRRFPIDVQPDGVFACEIAEHLIRSPHIMFLNINDWLPVGGKVLVTTPNGAQFNNPLRRATPTAAYRCNVYERHTYLYTLSGLTDLMELCGFRVVEAGFWEVYERSGPSSVYGLLARVPSPYFREKFARTIYVIGEKRESVTMLERCPRVYDSRARWEFIRPSDG